MNRYLLLVHLTKSITSNRNGPSNENGAKLFPVIVHHYMNTIHLLSRTIVEVSLHFNLLGSSIVYLILISNLTESVITNLSGAVSPLSSCQLLIITSIITMPITWLGSPKDVWFVTQLPPSHAISYILKKLPIYLLKSLHRR